MSIVLDGTTGITTPGLTNTGTETIVNLTTTGNTILGDASTDTLNVGNGGLVKNASGNVGIGTSSPSSRLDVRTSAAEIGRFSSSATNGGYQVFFPDNVATPVYVGSQKAILSTGNATDFAIVGTGANNMVFGTNATERMRIDSSGNVGVGTSSPTSAYRVSITGATGVVGGVALTTSGNTAYIGQISSTSADCEYWNAANGYMRFATNNTERMRIDSSGNLLVGATVGGGFTVFYAATDCINSRSGAAAGNATSLFVGRYSATSSTSGTLCFNVTTNGNVTNANNSYGSLSDVKLKENIVDVSPKLADLMQVRIVNYNFKEGQTHKQIGVVAQELEQVFPSMIEENSDYEEVTTTDEDGNETTERVATGTTTKSVKYSVFVPMLIKALQEQQAIITQLQADVEALKAQP